MANEGREVERYFRQHFEERRIDTVRFEQVFETDNGLFVRVDGLNVEPEGDVTLYEVKSSTGVKARAPHYQLKDACFQKICVERAGQPIDRVVLVHLNGDYERNGDVNPEELLVFHDVSERMAEIEEETAAEIDTALEMLEGEIDRHECSCLTKSRGNHCDAFDYFNPDIPRPSIYSLPRFYGPRLASLANQGLFQLGQLPVGVDLNPQQTAVLQAFRTGQPQIDRDAINRFLDDLEFPLYFLDYETYASAVPIINGASPHKHFTVQYSLHVLSEDYEMSHHEYLEPEARLPDRLLEQLEADIGPAGSVVSWHAAFERVQNNAMAERYPEKANFLLQVNDRMRDLEDPFKTAYVAPEFNGSTSIKKVLPVVCPALNYDDLEVQDGTAAMDAWKQMITAEPEEAGRLDRELRRYCEQDTLAMVEIYRFLRDL